MAANYESKFELLAKRWADDAYVTKPSAVPPVLYHYTDANGLVGMLSSGSIWATDYRFLNDKSEVEHTRKLAAKLITSKLTAQADSLLTAYCREISTYRDIDPTFDAYVFSLSEEADDLSQWRGYARNGQGFTVGFSGRSVFDLVETTQDDLELVQVEYRHDRQAEALDRAFDDFQRELRLCLKGGKVALADGCDTAAAWFDWMVESRAVSNKHQSFHLEREWRIVAAVDRDDKEKQVRVRASGLRLVRYIEMSLNKEKPPKLPILRIGIGPGFTGTEEFHAVKALCRKTGYDVEIYSADTPYRAL